MKIFKKIKEWFIVDAPKIDQLKELSDKEQLIQEFKTYFPDFLCMTWPDLTAHLSVYANRNLKKYIIRNQKLWEIDLRDNINVSNKLSQTTIENLEKNLNYLNGELEETDEGLYRHSITIDQGKIIWSKKLIYSFL